MIKPDVKFTPVGDVRVDAPAYASTGASGMDLRAALREPMTIPPGSRRLIPSGWSVAIPQGYEGQVRGRSGLALKHGVTVISIGTIDADYRGELGVLLVNHGSEPFVVKPKERIAQLVIAPVAHALRVFVNTLDPTERGTGGFGSTGIA